MCHTCLPRRLSVPALALVIAASTAQAQNAPSESALPPADVSSEMAFARSLSRAFQSAASKADQTVVHINSIEDRPVLRRGFRGTFRDRIQRQGLGSGVIVRDDGYILTNAHVIESATSLTVRLANGTEHSAEVVGTDDAGD